MQRRDSKLVIPSDCTGGRKPFLAAATLTITNVVYQFNHLPLDGWNGLAPVIAIFLNDNMSFFGGRAAHKKNDTASKNEKFSRIHYI
jgi:hypothetical protein